MSRMFTVAGKTMVTWNVFKGCRFFCRYCNASRLAKGRLKHSPRYQDGFAPAFIEAEMERSFHPGQFVFVAYMGDIFWAMAPDVERIIDRIRQFPETTFLFLTKAPEVYLQWEVDFPDNLLLGTTIESNRDHQVSKAPTAVERFQALSKVAHPRKFLSIEPIMDFDLGTLVSWVRDLHPEIVEVGADNYRNDLPEPSWGKVSALVCCLSDIVPEVVEKPGLDRLCREA